jgi:hypothetical protein
VGLEGPVIDQTTTVKQEVQSIEALSLSSRGRKDELSLSVRGIVLKLGVCVCVQRGRRRRGWTRLCVVRGGAEARTAAFGAEERERANERARSRSAPSRSTPPLALSLKETLLVVVVFPKQRLHGGGGAKE